MKEREEEIKSKKKDFEKVLKEKDEMIKTLSKSKEEGKVSMFEKKLSQKEKEYETLKAAFESQKKNVTESEIQILELNGRINQITQQKQQEIEKLKNKEKSLKQDLKKLESATQLKQGKESPLSYNLMIKLLRYSDIQKDGLLITEKQNILKQQSSNYIAVLGRKKVGKSTLVQALLSDAQSNMQVSSYPALDPHQGTNCLAII